jgi:hypothetical protein
MKGENRDFDKIGKIFTKLTEDNRENLITAAKRLLKTQRVDRAVLDNAVLLRKEETTNSSVRNRAD